jgi:hypothetical protein
LTNHIFVKRDDYLQDIKIGDVYIEKGFLSTTRDPFYRADLYQFGFILIKIKIPSNKNGIALCLETISHFSEEQEIIFPPNTKFKLVSRDENCDYYHTDINFTSKIKTKYEFEWIENEKIHFNRTIKFTNITEPIDFLNIRKSTSSLFIEKLNYFDKNYVNEMNQFNILLGDKNIIVTTEWFNSNGAYKEYYALETNLGYSIYSIYKGFILFYIEIAEINEVSHIHINYFVKYSSIDPHKIIGSENLIKFFSSVSHYFDINNVVIYSNYLNCGTDIIQTGGSDIIKTGGSKIRFGRQYNNQLEQIKHIKQRGFKSKAIKNTAVIKSNQLNKQNKQIQEGGLGRQRGFEVKPTKYSHSLVLAKQNTQNTQNIQNIQNTQNTQTEDNEEYLGIIGGSYCNDIYKYLLTGDKAYSDTTLLNVELQPLFSYYDLDYLKTVSPSEILTKIDRDEIFQIYEKYYKNLNKSDNIIDFYLWLIEENKCYLLDAYINKIDIILKNNNPFKNDMYVLDATSYLYNRKLISIYPSNIKLTNAIKRNIIKQQREIIFSEMRDV